MLGRTVLGIKYFRTRESLETIMSVRKIWNMMSEIKNRFDSCSYANLTLWENPTLKIGGKDGNWKIWMEASLLNLHQLTF